MLTPEDIEAREFLVSLRGFDRAEVRAFLSDVADQVRRLEDRVAAGEAARAAEVAEPLAAPTEAIAETPEPSAPAEDPSALFAGIGRETTRILDAAQEAAQGLIRQARVDADRQVQSARQQAARLIAEGEQRREEIEEIVAGLDAARESLSGNLHEVAVTIDHVLNELGTPPPVASTVREALTAEAAAETEEQSPAPELAPGESLLPGDEPQDAAEPAEEPGRVEEPLEAVERLEEPSGVVEDAGAPVRQAPEVPPLDRESAPPGDLAELADTADRGEPDDRGDSDGRSDAVDRDDSDDRGDSADRSDQGDDEALADVIDLQEDDGFADPQELRGQALAALHQPLVRALKRELQEAHNVVLDRLRRTAGQAELESLMPDDQVDRMGVAAAEYLQAAYQAGVHAAAILAERDLRAPTTERDLVAEFADDAANRVSGPLAATLRMGRSGSERPPALYDRVGAVFAELKGTVAEELAGGHIIRAYELGLLDAWTAGGITHRRWVLGREPRCPEARCRHNDRAGVVAMGESYPSGHEVPPIHVGCNCTTIPVSEPPS